MGKAQFPRPGTRLTGKKDVYVLGEPVDDRGASRVYMAEAESDGRIVAVRLFALKDLSEEDRARLKWDLGLRQQFAHPNVWPVLDRFRVTGFYCAVEKGVLVRDLTDYVGYQAALGKALEHLSKAADALQYIHEHSVIHNNVRPETIFLDETGEVELTGFEHSYVQGASALGPPAKKSLPADHSHVAPEVLSDPTQASPRSDVYSAGVTLYRIITGDVPYAQGRSASTWQARESPRSKNPDIPRSLEALVRRAIALDPRERQETAAELWQGVLVARSEITGSRESDSRMLTRDDAGLRATRGDDPQLWGALGEVGDLFGAKRRRDVATESDIGSSEFDPEGTNLDNSKGKGTWGDLPGLSPETPTAADQYLVPGSTERNLEETNSLNYRRDENVLPLLAGLDREAQTAADQYLVPGSGEHDPETIPSGTSFPRSASTTTRAERVPDLGFGTFLYFVEGPQKGLRVDLDRAEEHAIGRGNECDLTWDDHLLSRVHCTIRRRGEEFWIADCGSRNGTFVNNQRIQECPIYHGDSIRVGSSNLIFFAREKPEEGKGQRLQQILAFSKVWDELLAARNDTERFAVACERLVKDQLRPLLGFSIEEALPPAGFLAGWMVQTPRLWIRYTRFPILILYPRAGGGGGPSTPREGEELLERIVTMIATTQAREYFALVLLATDDAQEVDRIGHSVADSIYRYDLIVLGGPEVKSLFVANPVRRLVSLIQAKGLELSVLSPYVTGSPVSDAMFVGREDEVKKITQTIESNNIALLGGRRIGKTSTLQKVHRLFTKEKRYQTLYFDCHPIQDHESFFTALRYEGREAPGKNPLDFRFIVNQMLAKSGASKVIALFDEVDELVEFDARNGGRLVKVFRSLSQENKCRFVLSGERVLYRHLQTAESPFFNFCHKIDLDHLKPKNVEAIVARPMRQLGILGEEHEREVVDRVADFTAGHPYLVQDLCERAVKLVNERGGQGATLAPADLDSILAGATYLNEFKRTAFGTLNFFELALVYLLVANGVTLDDCFDKQALLDLLESHGLTFDDREVDVALEILHLFKVFRTQTQGDHILYRFALRRLPEVIQKTERAENVLDSYLREIQGESRYKIPSWGAFA
ncbi:MAG: FHA domain-containing protein [Planctomycetes bacterium]|nr:FHA domain-containing protein [Planctomycetota bacterium]